MKEIEQSNVKSFIKKMKKSIEISYKKNVVELGNQMLNIKYNIQNFSTYDRITEYLSKQKSILGFHLKNNMMEDFSISIDFVLKPIFDLVNAKLNEYPNVLQVFIFAINIYKITYEIFSDMEIFDLKKAKIDKLFEELYKGIEKANFSEFQKKGLLDKLLNKDTFSIKYFLEFLNLIFIEDLCSNE